MIDDCATVKYIKNEKEIAKYNISRLEQISEMKPSQKRLLDIEREFFLFPFEEMIFGDVADVMAAIAIYRMDRSMFRKTYKHEISEVDNRELKRELQILNDKISFLHKSATDWTSFRVEEINLIQNQDLYLEVVGNESRKRGTLFSFGERILGVMTIKQLAKIEPAPLAKKRARMQVATLSGGLYLVEELNILIGKMNDDPVFIGDIRNLEISPKATRQEALKSIEYYGNIVKDILYQFNDNLFKNYNAAKFEAIRILSGTMGANNSISKIHELRDLLSNSDNIPGAHTHSYTQFMLGNIMSIKKKILSKGLTKDASSRIQNKVCGILLPVKRKGNERMTLLYSDVYSKDVCLNGLFSKNISNVKVKSIDGDIKYYKALMMLPMWKVLVENWDTPDIRSVIADLIGVSSNLSLLDFDSTFTINKINNGSSKFIDISAGSRIMVPKTRSEDESIVSFLPWISERVNEVLVDFNEKFTTNE